MGILGDVFGGGSNKQTTSSEPWKGIQPYLTDIFQLAQNQYRNTAPQYYPGQTFAPMDPLQMGAQQMALSQVFGNSSLPQWWSPQMPGPSGALQGSFEQPYNAPPLPQSGGQPTNPFLSMFGNAQPFGSMYAGQNPYIPGAQSQMPQPMAQPPPGAPPPIQQGTPLPRSEYGLGPGQSGSAYDMGGGSRMYEGGAQPLWMQKKQDERRLNQNAQRMMGSLNVDYDRGQFSDSLNYYLNNRVLGFNQWDRDRQNQFLNKLVGFGPGLESQRTAASPEYAALRQQQANLRSPRTDFSR